MKEREPDAKVEIPEVWPEGCKILIEVDEAESISSGGIIIPPTLRQAEQLRLTKGTVLRCGPDVDARFGGERSLEAGSRIIFAKYGGFHLQDQSRKRDFRLINDEDVLAIVS